MSTTKNKPIPPYLPRAGYFPLIYVGRGLIFRGCVPHETDIEAGYVGYRIWHDIFALSHPHARIYVAFSIDIFEYVAPGWVEIESTGDLLDME